MCFSGNSPNEVYTSIKKANELKKQVSFADILSEPAAAQSGPKKTVAGVVKRGGHDSLMDEIKSRPNLKKVHLV